MQLNTTFTFNKLVTQRFLKTVQCRIIVLNISRKNFHFVSYVDGRLPSLKVNYVYINITCFRAEFKTFTMNALLTSSKKMVSNPQTEDSDDLPASQ